MRRHHYEIRVEEYLGDSWTEWFDGLSIRHQRDGSEGRAFSTLSGSMDQAALHGVLVRIGDLGLALIAVSRMDE